MQRLPEYPAYSIQAFVLWKLVCMPLTVCTKNKKMAKTIKLENKEEQQQKTKTKNKKQKQNKKTTTARYVNR